MEEAHENNVVGEGNVLKSDRNCVLGDNNLVQWYTSFTSFHYFLIINIIISSILLTNFF